VEFVQHHPTQAMKSREGDTVEIDIEMVPLIAQLWRLGFTTDMSCQDTGKYMRDGTPAHAPDDRDEASERIMGRAWVRVPAHQSSRLMDLVALLNPNGEWMVIERTHRVGWTSLTFPKDQIPAVVELLSAVDGC
jgi:hypothetical protein